MRSPDAVTVAEERGVRARERDLKLEGNIAAICDGDAEQREVPAMWLLRRNDAYGHTVGI